MNELRSVAEKSGRNPWVLVAGGFHERGGMDQLNAALARYLLSRDHPVHLVGHEFDAEFCAHESAAIYPISRPLGSIWLGQRGLHRAGWRVAREVRARSVDACVVANGANCASADVSWVHFLNHAWAPASDDGPPWLRLKTRLEHALARRDERHILPRAPLLLANSERTRRDLIERLAIDPSRIVTIYPASNLASVTPTRSRDQLRDVFGIHSDGPVLVFVGGLAYDRRKGFDRLWEAWRRLCARDDWTGSLVVAGGGRALAAWRDRVARAGLSGRVIMPGFTERLADLLGAADLLVSPARYEPYGMNVHEAIVAGVPAMVSASAGIAELYPDALRDFLLNDRDDAAALADCIWRWSKAPDRVRAAFAPFSRKLAARRPEQMAGDIVEAVNARVNTLSSANFRV